MSIASFEDVCHVFAEDVLDQIESITSSNTSPRLVDIIWGDKYKADFIDFKLNSTILMMNGTIRRASFMKSLSMLPEEDAVLILMHLEAHLVPLMGIKATCISNVVWSLAALPKHLRTDPEANAVLDVCCDDTWKFFEFAFAPHRCQDLSIMFEDIEQGSLLSVMAELF
jgi:hypothetical protein